MQREEIDENNMLIAEFMGWVNTNNYSWKVLEDGEWVTKTDREGLTFHYSWDALMPVVEKIKNTIRLGYFNIDSIWHDELRQDWVVQWSNSSPSKSFCIKRSDFKKDVNLIKLLWIAVIEFIKWYNLCKKEK